VARVAYKNGLSAEREPADIAAHVASQMYDPHYHSYV
jgi:hypothetical protein